MALLPEHRARFQTGAVFLPGLSDDLAVLVDGLGAASMVAWKRSYLQERGSIFFSFGPCHNHDDGSE